MQAEAKAQQSRLAGATAKLCARTAKTPLVASGTAAGNFAFEAQYLRDAPGGLYFARPLFPVHRVSFVLIQTAVVAGLKASFFKSPGGSDSFAGPGAPGIALRPHSGLGARLIGGRAGSPSSPCPVSFLRFWPRSGRLSVAPPGCLASQGGRRCPLVPAVLVRLFSPLVGSFYSGPPLSWRRHKPPLFSARGDVVFYAPKRLR